jgi:DNA-binding transcriptional LysR family regulator
MIDLRHLKYFIAVAEELHFRRAAERLHIAQPGLSQQVQALERQLGVELLQRSRRRVQLTFAGRTLLEEGRRVLALLERAEVLTGLAGQGEIGHLTIGVIRSATFGILPRLLHEYRGRCPAVALIVRDLVSAVQVEGLRRGEIDVGLVRTPVNTDGLIARAISRDQVAVVAPEMHPLAKLDGVPLKALAKEPLIIWPAAPRPSWADNMIAMCHHAGFEPRIAQEANDVGTALSFVAAGLGLTLVPESVMGLTWRGVIFRRVPDPAYTTKILLVHRKEALSETLKQFLAVAKDLWPQESARRNANEGAFGNAEPLVPTRRK